MVTYRVVPRLPIQLMQALEIRAPIVVPIENDDPVGNWKLDNHILIFFRSTCSSDMTKVTGSDLLTRSTSARFISKFLSLCMDGMADEG